MLEALRAWLSDKITPFLQLWPEDQLMRLGATLIACILLSGQLARMCMQLPLRSLQGRIAVTHLVFIAGFAGLLFSLIDMSWQPLFVSLCVIVALSPPFYLLGRITEKAERTARGAIQVELRERGMREKVLEEIREQKIDEVLYQQAASRADGDEKKLRHDYIGLRSRKLARLQIDRDQLDPSSAEYGRVEFELTDEIIQKSKTFNEREREPSETP